MDGSLSIIQDNVLKYVRQVRHYMVIWILSDVLIHVQNKDISLLQIQKGHAEHTALLHTWVIYMLIIPHGLALVFVLKNQIFLVSSIHLTLLLERVLLLAL